MSLQTQATALFAKFGLVAGADSFAQLNARIATANPAIDRRFQLLPAGEAQLQVSFRPSHVEILLDQTADLLDRAVKTRGKWQGLAAKEATLDIELSQFLQLDAVQQTAEAGPNSVFNLPALESAGAVAANQRTIDALTNAVAQLQTILTSQFSTQAIQDREARAAGLAALSAPGPNSAAFFAGKQEETLIVTQGQSIMSQVSSLSGQLNASQALTASLQARAAFDVANVGFQTQRTQIQRDIVSLKVAARDQPGGAFNFREQRAVLQTAFDNDFDHALRRVPAIRDGLATYFDYQPPLPASIQDILNGAPAGVANALDDLMIWIRNAIDFVVAISQSEQSYVFRISLKRLMTDEAFSAGLTAGALEFNLPAEAYFQGQNTVRLRGVVCAIVGADARGAWSGSISVPASAVYRSRAGETKVLDQQNLTCTLGKVANVTDRPSMNAVGNVTFRNASPIGNENSKWRLTLAGTSTEGVALTSVADVNLELSIVSCNG